MEPAGGNYKTERLQLRKQQIQEQWVLLNRKLSGLELERIRENRYEEIFRLDQQIAGLKEQWQTLENEIQSIEEHIAVSSLDCVKVIDSENHAYPAGLNGYNVFNTGRALDRKSGNEFLEYGIEKEFKENKFNTFTIAMIDIDDLTQINNIFGQHIGDKVIARFCLLLSKEISAIFPVGRCGDDTFFALFWGLAENKSRQQCEVLMRKLQNFNWSKLSKKLWVTSSIGFSVHNQMEPVRDTIIRAAQAMLTAKEKGKNKLEEASEHLSPSESRHFRDYYS